jgi:hypothetical protein
MRDLDTIMSDARDGSPFSNSTSGEMWMGEWCYRCKVDAPFQRDEAPEGCPLILVALLDKTPAEWTETGIQDYHCSEFDEDHGYGGHDGEGPPVGPTWPQPVVEMEGQTDLFSVFADQITDTARVEKANA